jgi:hypothetical protein
MITDLEARKIASDWHGGQGTALYALSSTGAIDSAHYSHDVSAEIKANIAMVSRCRSTQGYRDAYTQEDHENLMALLAYALGYGERNPVDGWSKLTW